VTFRLAQSAGGVTLDAGRLSGPSPDAHHTLSLAEKSSIWRSPGLVDHQQCRLQNCDLLPRIFVDLRLTLAAQKALGAIREQA